MNKFTFEKNKLYSYLGKELVRLFKKYEVIVAGGTITSLFSNSDINDVDIYIRDQEAGIGLFEELWSVHVLSNTNKAVQFHYDHDKVLQIIHFKEFDNVKDIFDTFDYTVCMGAFDFKTEEFVLHDDFLKHNAQRLIKFNSGTAYPIISLLRVDKYKEKGYSISKAEFIRIALTCMNLNINTYEELKEHMGGMYGEAYDKLFDGLEDEEFDLMTTVDKIANMVYSSDYFKMPNVEEYKLEEVIKNMQKRPMKYIKLGKNIFGREEVLRVGYNNELSISEMDEKDGIEVDPETVFGGEFKLYKYVNKRDDKYFSIHDSRFEYKIGEEVGCKGSLSGSALYFNKLDMINHSTYHNDLFKEASNKVMIECVVKTKDIIRYGTTITVSKCKVIREVPKSEWIHKEVK